MGMDSSNPEVRDQERNGKKPSSKFGNGKGTKKTFLKFGNGKGKKKSIPIFRERESEAIIPGNSWEQEQECKTKNKIII